MIHCHRPVRRSLYDQDGRPIVPATDGLVTDVPTGSDGLPIPNAYPLIERDKNSDPLLAPRVALPPWPSNSPTPSAAPSSSR